MATILGDVQYSQVMGHLPTPGYVYGSTRQNRPVGQLLNPCWGQVEAQIFCSPWPRPQHDCWPRSLCNCSSITHCQVNWQADKGRLSLGLLELYKAGLELSRGLRLENVWDMWITDAQYIACVYSANWLSVSCMPAVSRLTMTLVTQQSSCFPLLSIQAEASTGWEYSLVMSGVVEKNTF